MINLAPWLITDKELETAKIGLFVKLTGCSCFVCNCYYWKMIQLDKKELIKNGNGFNLISETILDRERERITQFSNSQKIKFITRKKTK